MVSSQLLIAEIGTEIRDRIVKDGCHVQAVLLRPRPGRRETIFGKDLGKQDPDGILHDGMTLGGGTGSQLSCTGPLNCPNCWNSSFVGNTYVPRVRSQITKMGQACA